MNVDPLDELIKRFLASEMARRPGGRAASAPTEEDFCDYLEGRMDEPRLEEFLAHLTTDPWARELLVRAREIASSTEGGGPLPAVPEQAVAKARETFGSGRSSGVPAPLSCPHCHKRITAFPKDPARARRAGLLWLLLAAAAFGLSFLVPRYFIQCLLVALLAGLKWIWDGRVMRTQVLVYKALRESAETDDLQKHSSHL